MEIALVMGITGILTILATPLFITYYQSSRLRVAAEEVAAFVNQGRQLGIRENTGACVHVTSTALQYFVGTSCSGTTWKGAGTDTAGNIPVPEGITLATTADPIFTYLGAGAVTVGVTWPVSITVTNTQTAAVLQVRVAASGRVTVGP
jgi:Tfp pilus assembly protein FimT